MKGLRRAIFFNPGKGAPHEIVIRVTGTASNGSKQTLHLNVVDHQGQSHLTACGAVSGIERVLELDSVPPLPPGLHHPDSFPDVENLLKILLESGVEVESTEVESTRNAITSEAT